MKVALVIGHHPVYEGATLPNGRGEFNFYDEYHDGVDGEPFDGFVDDVIRSYTGPHELIRITRPGQGQPVSEVNASKCNYFVSFHFNASDNPKATGSEVLYYYKSVKSKKIAEVFVKHIQLALSLPLRQGGTGLLPRTPNDRGASILYKTTMPGVLLEPFFGSNPDDWERVKERYHTFVRHICLAIDEAAGVL